MLKKNPSLDFVEKLLHCFGLQNLYDNQYISKSILKMNHTVEKIRILLMELQQYYLPCKVNVYLTNINENKSLTILKHFIKPFNYILQKKEIVEKNKKIMLYSLCQIKNHSVLIKKIDKTISF
jgi:hypothetical protein